MDVGTTTRALSLTQQMMPSSAQIARARRRLHHKAAFIAVLTVGSYGALVFAPVGFVLRVVFTMMLVVGSVAIATSVMHDGNHGAFSTSQRFNRIAGWSSDLLGASSYLWRFKHNRLHHGNTNVVGYDLDIDQVPFARLAPQQPRRPWHRYQIEHHLAPKLPHTIYPQVAPCLEAACAERGVTYRTHPSVTDAVRSHARWLRTMGQDPHQSPPRQAGIER